MKRTLRLLAAPAVAALLLASCGSSEPEASEPTAATEASGGTEASDGGDSQPAAEDEAGENAEEQPMDDSGDDTMYDDQGNQTEVEFGDETYEFDLDALIDGAVPTSGMFYLEGETGVKALAEVGAEGPEELEAMRESVGADPVTYIRFDVDNREGSEEIGMYEFLMYDAEGQEYAFTPVTNTLNEWGDSVDEYTDEQRDLHDNIDSATLSQNANPLQRNEQWLVGPGDLPETVVGTAATAEAFTDHFAPIPVK